MKPEDLNTYSAPLPPLRGRLREQLRLRHLLQIPAGGPRSVTVVGDRGAGKSALLRDAADAAASLGVHVVWVAASKRSSTNTLAAFADFIDELAAWIPATSPTAQHVLLRFRHPSNSPTDFELGTLVDASRELMKAATRQRPVALFLDDAQWLDDATRHIVLAQRGALPNHPAVVIASLRTAGSIPGFMENATLLRLTPLDGRTSSTVVRDWGPALTPRSVSDVVDQARGLPGALVDLAQMAAKAAEPPASWSKAPIPVSQRSYYTLANKLQKLPETVQRELTLLAVADGDTGADLPALEAFCGSDASKDLILRDSRGRIVFAHPLLASVLFHSASRSERAAAHRAWALAVTALPHRKAWHLGLAALSYDDALADELESFSRQARLRDGSHGAAAFLERAAALSSRAGVRSRRYSAAARAASTSGETKWARALASMALEAATDPAQEVAAKIRLAAAGQWHHPHFALFQDLLQFASDDTSSFDDAWEAIGNAATFAFQWGENSANEELARVNESLWNDHQHRWVERRHEAEVGHVWVRSALSTSLAERNDLLKHLRRLAAPRVQTATSHGLLGGSFGILDEPTESIHHLRASLEMLTSPLMQGDNAAILMGLALSQASIGLFEDALESTRAAHDLALDNEDVPGRAAALTLSAYVSGMRGDTRRARLNAQEATDLLGSTPNRAIRVMLQHARALIDLANGDSTSAYIKLRTLFNADGRPVHHRQSYRALADFAYAAAGASQQAAALTIVMLALEAKAESPRMRQILSRAHGLVADDSQAGNLFAAGLQDENGNAWPYERALLQLDYGEWLRRHRQVSQARNVLRSAHTTFATLGAVPLRRRAAAELEAAGEVPTDTNAVLSRLTPQQRRVALLAAQGLTNPQISESLRISRTTVATHLSAAFARLELRDRNQLAAVLAATSHSS